MPRRSTELSLASFNNDILESLSDESQTDVIYIDFAKAFDTVDHGIVLSKLASYNIDSGILKFFEAYLTDRTQQVRINKSFSRPYRVNTGIPQGSHSGPVLFLTFINGLPNVIHYSNISIFADDVRLYKQINSP